MLNYMEVWKKCLQDIKPIAEFYGKTKLYFIIDVVFSCIRYGCTPNQYFRFRFYEKSNAERETFFVQRKYKSPRFMAKLNDLNYFNTFRNKQEFNIRFSDFVKRDWLCCENASEDEIYNFIINHKKVIVKPTSDDCGNGIHIYSENESVKQLAGNSYIIEEYVEQSKSFSDLNPSSLNTIRIYTMIDKNEKVHVLSAAIRVGAKNSCIDNFSNGGIAYPLDIENGVVCGYGLDKKLNKYLYSPVTGAKVIGLEVNNWKILLDLVKRAACLIPTVRYVAWDIAVLENGFEFIEGNWQGAIIVLQAPLNKGCYREIKKFMK